MYEQTEDEAQEHDDTGRETDLAFHAPAGPRVTGGRCVQVVPRGGPGTGTSGESGGGNAPLGQQLAGVA